MSRKNIDTFNLAINGTDWSTITNMTDTQMAYTKFHSTITDIFNSSFPYKKEKTPYHNKLPWLSEDIKRAIKMKHLLFKKELLRPNPHNVLKYNKFQNHLNHTIRTAERAYYHSQLVLNKSNLRKSWQVINMAINRKKKSNKGISSLTINGTKISDPMTIAEHFTKYFTNIGKTLDKKIPISNTDPISYIPDRIPNSIYF